MFDSSHPSLGAIFFSSLLNRHGSWLDDHWYFGKLPLKERPYHCVWGNGDEFNEKEMEKIRKAHDSCTEKLVLNESEIVVIDNLRLQHGRSPYTGERALGLLMSDMVPRKYKKPVASFLAMKDALSNIVVE